MSRAADPAAVTQVLLVRHGRTAVNAQGRLSGRHDPPLDDVGEAQARAVAAAVGGVTGDAPVTVVSSPLRRCLRTAEVVARACELDPAEVIVDGRFIEMDYGAWDGRPLTEVSPEDWRRWRTDEAFSPPEGETLAAVTLRVSQGLTDWSSRCAGATVVVASHVSPIKAGVIWALGVGEPATWRMRLSNASITALEVSVGAGGEPFATLTAFNQTSHLDRKG